MAQTNEPLATAAPVAPGSGMPNSEMNNKLISECRGLFNDNYTKILEDFFSNIDDEFFALSEKAGNGSDQTRYFDAMRYIRQERDGVQNSYLSLAFRQYDAFFWKKQSDKNDQPGAGTLTSMDLSLVDNDVLEDDLAITTMVDKGNNASYEELSALNKRFAVIAGRKTVSLEDNPIAPYLLCRAFKTVAEPLTLDTNVKLYFYMFFEKQVIKQLGPIYDQLNERLILRDILPEIKSKIKKSSGGGNHERNSGDEDKKQAAEKPVVTISPEELAAHAEVFQSMQSVLGDWRKRSGIEVSQGTGPAYEADDVLDSLSMLQASSADLSSLGATDKMLEQGLKLIVTKELERLQPEGTEARPLSGADEDVIDMVSMIFGFILEDENLPDPIKLLLGRLQIPLVKVAIIEKAFFAEKEHPARLLLNCLAQAGVGVDESSYAVNPVYEKIKFVTEQILAEFEKGAGVFGELLEDFQVFLSKEEQRSEMIESRTRQTTQSKEQVALARQKVLHEIALKSQGKQIPKAVKKLLVKAWRDVLQLSYLRQQKEPDKWEQSLAVVDELIASVNYSGLLSSVDRKKAAAEIVALVKTMRKGLEDISYDTERMAKMFKDLKVCHIACLGSRPMPDVTIGPVVTEAEAVIDSVEHAEFDAEEIVMGDSTSSATGVDQFVQQANALEVGQWLEFVDESDKKVRAKLSWKSQVTSSCVFVNRKGVKVAEKTLQGLAVELRRGAAREIAQSDLPLMERAFNAIMTTIKGSEDNEAPMQELMA